MLVKCTRQALSPTLQTTGCGRLYDDETSWTICPHGPLSAGLDAYCREHDLVDCKFHVERKDEPTPAQLGCGYALYGPPALCTCGTCPVTEA